MTNYFESVLSILKEDKRFFAEGGIFFAQCCL